MDDDALVDKLMRDIVFLEVAGINPVVVHGGGKAISAAMANAGLVAEFIGGFRVTTSEAIGLVEETLSGTINPRLVELINQHGGRATGISGTDVFLSQRIQGKQEDGTPADIGRVGKVTQCHTEDLLYAITSEVVPVISPLGREEDTGKSLNINADLAAAALACALKPAKLVFLSDVPGLMRDPADPSTLIPSVTRQEADALLADGTISGGMIPKITSALDALDTGVEKVHFIDGRVPHSLLLEIFTKSGTGTQILS